MEAEREIERDYTVIEFVAELRKLADALEANGRFSLTGDEEEIVVPQTATASMSYEVEDGRAELEFQLSWETGEAEDEEDEGEDETDGDEESASENEADEKTADEKAEEKA